MTSYERNHRRQSRWTGRVARSLLATFGSAGLIACSGSLPNTDPGVRDANAGDFHGFHDTGRLADTVGPQPETDLPPAGDGGPLRPLVSDPFHEYAPPGPDDLGEQVSGGKPPLTCSVYIGPGRGTTPGNLVIFGCTLTGGFSPDDAPGLYGFIVVVRDQAGQTIEIPVAAKNGNCDTAVGKLTPAPYPPLVVAPGAAHTWKLAITDVDALCTNAQCADCIGCVLHGVETKKPLHLATLGDCAQPGDVCAANGDIVDPPTCPNVVDWAADIVLKAHTPLRADGSPAWATIASDATYSGTKTGFDCGDKTWRCHWELLER